MILQPSESKTNPAPYFHVPLSCLSPSAVQILFCRKREVDCFTQIHTFSCVNTAVFMAKLC